MSIDNNTSEETLTNEVLSEGNSNVSTNNVDEVVAQLEKQLEEAKAQARKANYRVEQEIKEKKDFNTRIEEINTKLSNIDDIKTDLLSLKNENDELKKIISSKSSETVNISSQPIVSNTDSNVEQQANLIRKQMGLIK